MIASSYEETGPGKGPTENRGREGSAKSRWQWRGEEYPRGWIGLESGAGGCSSPPAGMDGIYISLVQPRISLAVVTRARSIMAGKMARPAR
jgi:hypothetical protein